eukprot:scaffold2250_cov399-Prasinococcus_capsulatus_cf.AAC.11
MVPFRMLSRERRYSRHATVVEPLAAFACSSCDLCLLSNAFYRTGLNTAEVDRPKAAPRAGGLCDLQALSYVRLLPETCQPSQCSPLCWKHWHISSPSLCRPGCCLAKAACSPRGHILWLVRQPAARKPTSALPPVGSNPELVSLRHGRVNGCASPAACRALASGDPTPARRPCLPTSLGTSGHRRAALSSSSTSAPAASGTRRGGGRGLPLSLARSRD